MHLGSVGFYHVQSLAFLGNVMQPFLVDKSEKNTHSSLESSNHILHSQAVSFCSRIVIISREKYDICKFV